jgi:hypothetical protein
MSDYPGTVDHYATLTAEERLASARRHLEWVRKCLAEDIAAQAELMKANNLFAAGVTHGTHRSLNYLTIFDAVLAAPTSGDEERPGCDCGAPASKCRWAGDIRREWACDRCHAGRGNE